MKPIITLLITLLITISSFAQSIGFNYKAVVMDDNGNVLTNQNVKLKFTILGSGNNNVYQETHTTTTDANGIVIVIIGEGTEAITGSFYNIDWANDLFSLKTEIDPEPYGFFVPLGTAPFKSVPYAKHAAIASNVFSGDYNDLTNQPPINTSSGLEKISEVNPETGFTQTGWRLIGRNPTNYGTIGSGAVDLSYSTSDASEKKGATGIYSTAIGYNSEASKFKSTAIGNYANASETNSIAIGSAVSASGVGSTAMGSYTIASGNSSTAMGDNTNASGENATAMGVKTTAQSYAEIAIGSHNTSYIPENTTDWDENDRLFVIGNGQSPSTTNNAVTVLKNGNVGIGAENPESLLEVTHQNVSPATNLKNAFSIRNSTTNHSWQFYTATYLNLYKNGVFKGSWNSNSGAYVQASDRKVKKDIISLKNGTLKKVMQLNPVSYLMKDQTDTKRNLGLISQEVQKLFPSITHYVKDSDLLALSYTELIPVLIKALQEQQNIIESQNSKINTQNSKIDTIESLMATLSKRLENLEVINN